MAFSEFESAGERGMNDKEFSIAKEFSVFPGPRKKRQGADSGEGLGEVLAKRLRASPGRFRIILDGTVGIGSSFLDEAFGGLVSEHGFDATELERRLDIVSEMDPSYLYTIHNSIVRAAKAQAS